MRPEAGRALESAPPDARAQFEAMLSRVRNPLHRSAFRHSESLHTTDLKVWKPHAQQRMLYWLDRIYGVHYACLRYFNAAGATETHGEDHDPELHLIPLVLQVAMGKREKVFIFGGDYPTRDGTCVRDYIHVIDLAQAHILALRALDEGSRVYNLGNSEGFTVKEVIDAARAVTGHPIPAEVGPRRPGDPAVLVASSAKIRQELGWKPRFPQVRDIIESAWRWHQAHPKGYGD